MQKQAKPPKFLEVTPFEYICFTADAFYFVKTLHAIQGHENVYGLVTFWRNNQFVAITTHLRSCQRENHIHYLFLHLNHIKAVTKYQTFDSVMH